MNPDNAQYRRYHDLIDHVVNDISTGQALCGRGALVPAGGEGAVNP